MYIVLNCIMSLLKKVPYFYKIIRKMQKFKGNELNSDDNNTRRKTDTIWIRDIYEGFQNFNATY